MAVKKKSFYKFLRDSTNPDPLTNFQAIGDMPTDKTFSIGPPGNEQWEVHRMMIQVVDAGTMDSGQYGNGIVFGEGEGVRVVVLSETGEVAADLTDGYIIQTNEDWEALCFDVDPSKYGAGNEYLGARWTFEKAGAPLHLSSGQKLAVICKGNFDLVAHTFFAQGQRTIHTFN